MRTILLLLVTMAITAASGPISPAGGQAMAIGDARRLPPGETVTVEGHVSVPSRFIDAGFALGDSSGGIYVDADSFPIFYEFTHLRVTGRLVTSHGLLRIAPTSIEALEQGPEVSVWLRSAATGAVGEATEGQVIQIEGPIVGEIVDDRPYGWKITIDDGSGPLLVFISVAARINVSRFRTGQRLRVHGFSGQYDDHYEIIPGSASGVKIIAEP